MRILLVGHSLLNPWAIYTQRALVRLGHTVRRFYCTSLLLDRLTLSRDRDTDGQPVDPPREMQNLRNAWRRVRDFKLLRAARTFRPHQTLVLWGNTLSPELLTALKRQTPSPLVTWWVDDPFRHPVEKLIPLYDFFFVFDRSYLRPLKERGAREVRFLPCACDETVYYPRRLSRREQARYGSEVALVAWHYPARARVVQALAGVDLKIWGRGWPPPWAQRDRFVRDEVAAKIYSAAKIGLNIHSDQTRDGGLNTRCFELLAAGAFQVMDAVDGMEEMLLAQQEVAVYRSPEEARDLVRYYLKHPEQRGAMAQRGRQRVLSQHTFVHRMKELLREVGS